MRRMRIGISRGLINRLSSLTTVEFHITQRRFERYEFVERSNGVQTMHEQQQYSSHDLPTMVGTVANHQMERLDSHTVHLDRDFYTSFKNNLGKATGLVLIQSPFIATKRIESLRDSIKDCMRRKVRICVFVQKLAANADQTRVQSHQSALKVLREMEVHVTEVPDIHEKVAVIDENIAWDGSLNILSQSKTKERMTRWDSHSKASEIKRSHRLDRCGECCKLLALKRVLGCSSYMGQNLMV